MTKTYRTLLPVFLLIFLLIVDNAAFAQTRIHYKLTMEKPWTHYYSVEMSVAGVTADSLDFKMPVWTPGSYLIREFEKNVEDFKAESASGSELSFYKIDKNTWRVRTDKNDAVVVTYKVYAFTISVRNSFLDESHGFINGTSVFMFVQGMKNLPVSLTIIPYKKWNVISTGLNNTDDGEWKYSAPNYDVLADSPIEIGNQHEIKFEADDVDYTIAMYGRANYEDDQVIEGVKKIVETATSIFGGNPNKKYVFIVHNLDQGGGGLEHLNSATLEVNRWTYKPESSLRRFFSLVSHEYFHLWNVKRIRAAALGPFNYNTENYTHLLWEMEGVTSYYSGQVMLRAGFSNPTSYINGWASTISAMENTPGNRVQSVADASFDAWIKAYRWNENSYNTTISYYTKGMVLGLLLDLEIIHATEGENNYDDVLRYLYDEYYLKLHRGFTDEEYKKAVEKIAGENLDDFFRDYVFGTVPIDYQKFFNYAGIEVIKGPEDDSIPQLGVRLNNRGDKLTISTVIRNTPAYKCGLNVNDEIVAINGYRINKTVYDKILSTSSAGDTLNIMVSRGGIIKSFKVELEKNKNSEYVLRRIDNPSGEQDMVFKKWLRIN